MQAAKKGPLLSSPLLSFPLVPSTTNDVSGGGASQTEEGGKRVFTQGVVYIHGKRRKGRGKSTSHRSQKRSYGESGGEDNVS